MARRRSYGRKGFSFAPFIFIFGFLAYCLVVFISAIKKALPKVHTWGLGNWAIFIFIVGGLATLYIVADRQSKRFASTERPYRPYKAKKGRTITEITAGYSSRDFEYFVADLYRHLGYHAEVTPATNDHGKDIILTKDNETIYVECKFHSAKNKIGREMLQKFYGAMMKDKIERGFFVTTSTFHKNAQDYAEGTGIELVDDYDLLKIIEQVRPELLYEEIVPDTEPIV